MTISDIIRDIGRRLKAVFPESAMYTDDIPAGAEGNFLLVISEITGGSGISARKKRGASFDLIYFSKPRDAVRFADWAAVAENTLGTLSCEGRLVRTAGHNAVQTDMQYHFMFTVSADYIEYEPGEPMEEMEATIERTE